METGVPEVQSCVLQRESSGERVDRGRGILPAILRVLKISVLKVGVAMKASVVYFRIGVLLSLAGVALSAVMEIDMEPFETFMLCLIVSKLCELQGD